MPQAFDVSVTTVGDKAEVAVTGELDFHSAPKLRETILGLVADGNVDVIVDLSKLDFIDSSGLGILVAAFNRTREEGGSLYLRSPSPQTSRVLEISGLNKLLSVV